MAYSGTFKPKNPRKYKGDPTNIVYRSRWEARFMSYLDTHPDVLEWSSEEVIVPYVSPIDGKWHRYFPDFVVKKVDSKTKKIQTLMIEIKPEAQTKEPAKKTRVTPKYINEVKTWGVNSSKWKSANEYCKDRGWKFMILTEKNLGINF